MSRSMTRTARLIVYAILILFAFAVFAAITFFNLQSKISTRLEKGWVLPPLELYSQGNALTLGRRLPRTEIENDLQNKGWTQPRDYRLENAETCAQIAGLEMKDRALPCLWIRDPALIVLWDEAGFIQDIRQGPDWRQVDHFALFPRLIAQFFDGQPILQQNTPLSEMPLACLQAVTAIEDREFLEHNGVSATGIARAIYRNLRAGRWAEGGSTITQQLVKNFFLNSKKTLHRKIEEQILAVMLESQLGKDKILEMYLNVIYMGQSGPYQVRGLGSAAQTYFERPISQLGLSDCALLAAMINSPGRYSPFEHPDAALQRRELVLRKMFEAQMIGNDELEVAKTQLLPKPPTKGHRAHAPYFVMSALKEFQNLEIESESGARLYTTMDPEVQTAVSSGVGKVLPIVEKRIKRPSKQPLEIAAITADVASGQVLALIGGHEFRSTQYNRATDARRQIGSTIKPFVYYPALRDGSPLTPVLDEPFEWKSGKQVWRPKNYEKKNFGNVPYFFALAESLNVPAAKVGQNVGLDSVGAALKSAGVSVDIPQLPSLTLGALELSPFEVVQAYLTLARMGRYEKLHLLARVEDTSGGVLYQYAPLDTPALDPGQTAVLIGMMKQTIELGTARAARALGLLGPYAGKTGTTSDTKDAWFVGFNRRTLTLVWVGYDDNTELGLTGAGAALPIWVEISKAIGNRFENSDFAWPAEVEEREVQKADLLRDFPALQNIPDRIDLIFPNWAS